MPRHLRHFSPTSALENIESINLAGLWADGKRLILLDVDNTLIPWRSHDIPETVHAWLASARQIGFDFCILSNTRNPERLAKLAAAMEVEAIRDKFKPSRAMYNAALAKFGRTPSEAVMVGDQLLTDVLGANRAGIDAIWIKPIGQREFVGTRLLSRNVERILGSFLYRYFQADEDEGEHPPDKPGVFQHAVVGQFAKFIVVGASSTIIDVGLLFVLMFFIRVNGVELGTVVGQWLIESFPSLFGWAKEPSKAAVPVLGAVSTSLAIVNSFIWNRLWTWGISGSTARAAQFRKFFIVSIVGFALNNGLKTFFNSVIPGHAKLSLAVASAIAVVVVAFWNFFGQKLWAFKPEDDDFEDETSDSTDALQPEEPMEDPKP
ncbi:MAG: YqeG family HAD IIIA-type phosphatase [Armatimonadetes bacterium]|nr:YqeG family HAD IIIA-type phosphatase [Armatimonadota bacterium]